MSVGLLWMEWKMTRRARYGDGSDGVFVNEVNRIWGCDGGVKVVD